MDTHRNGNPWIGLESYKEGEILYGRDEDIRDLTQCVLNAVSTLLFGKSGIGKSSILNAGVIPAVRRKGYLPVIIRFSHKGKSTYLQQIREFIENAMIPIPVGEDGKIREMTEEERLQRCKNLALRIKEVIPGSEKETIYEYFHRHTFHDENGERIGLLLIFDQFEEIFTLMREEGYKREFFAQLSDMLNDVVPAYMQKKLPNISDYGQLEEVNLSNTSELNDIFKSLTLEEDVVATEYVNDNNIHFVFTIREDFLSEFEYYTASIPVLKQNRYGLRPISEEQAAQIILSPAPGLIDEDVAKLIIERVTGRTDFKINGIPEIEVDAAVLSLYLNRLFEAHSGKKITAELIEQKGGKIITDFYNDAIKDISENTIDYLEEKLINGEGRRENISVYNAIHSGNVTEEELDILCDTKKILRKFYYAGVLRIEYVHDILCPIVKSHIEQREMAKKAEEERRVYELETQRLLAEEKRKFEELEDKEKKAKRKTRLKAICIVSVVSILAVVGIGYFAYNAYKTKQEAKEVVQMARSALVTEKGTLVTFEIQEDSLSVTDDDKWEINVSLCWFDTIWQKKNLRIAKEDINRQIPPLWINADSTLIMTVNFEKNNVYMPFDNSVNNDSVFTAERLIKNESKVPIIIKKNVSIFKGRAVAVIEGDTIPIRDEHVMVSTGTTKTNLNGYFTLRTPYSESDKQPMLSRKGLKLKTSKSTNTGQLLVYELSDSIQKFKQECDSIYNSYELAKKSTPSHIYRHTFYCNDKKGKVELIYTKPSPNGYSKGYFYLVETGKKTNYWRYFLGEGVMDLHYNKEGLRSLIFKGKDAVGNIATLRSLIIDNDLYVYLYLSDKDQIFINKIEGLSKK